jgi:hypothetical protein
MKVGDLEIPDSALEAALKATGKRVVEEEDYKSKASAANDLAKFRKVTGDGRSVEEIEGIVKAYEEAQNKNKTQVELLTAETKRLQKELTAQAGEVKKAQLEVRKRDVKSYFEQAMEANSLKVIDPILEPFRQEFYTLDEANITPEILRERVGQALLKASEIQTGELARLGINGRSPEPAGPSFGAGVASVTPGNARSASSEVDLFKIMRETSAGPLGAALSAKRVEGK